MDNYNYVLEYMRSLDKKELSALTGYSQPNTSKLTSPKKKDIYFSYVARMLDNLGVKIPLPARKVTWGVAIARLLVRSAENEYGKMNISHDTPIAEVIDVCFQKGMTHAEISSYFSSAITAHEKSLNSQTVIFGEVAEEPGRYGDNIKKNLTTRARKSKKSNRF